MACASTPLSLNSHRNVNLTHTPCVRTVHVVASVTMTCANASQPQDRQREVSRGASHCRRLDERGLVANGRQTMFRRNHRTRSWLRDWGNGTMLVTDLAYRDMNARADGLFQRFGSLIGNVLRRTTQHPSNCDGVFVLGPEHTAHLKLTPLTARKSPSADHPAETANGVFRWRRHPQLLNHSETSEPDPDELERGARSAGVRGLFLARSGRFDEARAAFAMAAAESTIDLTAIPGFWDLSRGGMHAAVNAYEDVERYRDASALGARIRLKYRPRSISPLRDMVERKTSASGS